MKAYSKFFLCAFLWGFLLKDSHAAGRFDLSYFKLDNGLEVVVLPNHRAPLVLVRLYYKAGAADGPVGKNGIAHFLEHLLFKGTEKFPDFDNEIDKRGGSNNASTGQDVTTYYEIMAKEYLPLILEMEADRMVHIRLNDNIVLPERDVILEERRQRIENNPEAQLGEARNAALYLNHPYRLPVIGWMHEIATLTTQDALDFYKRYYAPDNAVLVVAGDVTQAEVRPLVEKFFGPLPSQATPQRLRVQEPERRASISLELKSKLTELPGFSRAYLAPSYRTAKGPDAYALIVLNEILSGSTGILYRNLTLDRKIAADTGASYSPRPYDDSAFTFWAYLYDSKNFGEAMAAFDKTIAEIRQKGVSQDELERAKKRLKIMSIKTSAGLFGPADIVGTALATGRKIEDVQNWLDYIQSITNDDIIKAANSIFQEKNRVDTKILPDHP